MARKLMIVSMLLGTFALGYLSGTVSERATAQSLKGVLEQAGQASGTLGAAGQLGSSIVEMQEHVSGLQKNLDSLKKVQSLLTGK